MARNGGLGVVFSWLWEVLGEPDVVPGLDACGCGFGCGVAFGPEVTGYGWDVGRVSEAVEAGAGVFGAEAVLLVESAVGGGDGFEVDGRVLVVGFEDGVVHVKGVVVHSSRTARSRLAGSGGCVYFAAGVAGGGVAAARATV